jgi:glycosyltransferase involved in cell wall biosynthesis
MSSQGASPPKRVLYFYPHLNVDTGSPMVLLRMVDLLDRRRFTPLFLSSGEGPLTSALRERHVEIVHGTIGEVTPRALVASSRAVWRQRALLRDLAIDLVHLNHFGWNQDLVVAAWFNRVPVILHMHNPENVAARNLNRLIARRIVIVSEALKSDITGFSRIRRKCEVLYNPVELGTYGAGQSIRAALGLHADDFVVGTIAQLQHHKGIDLLLETARRVLAVRDHVIFLHVGPPGHNEAEFARNIQERAQETEFRGRVRFLGPRRDIPDLLASMDALFHPARREPFGLVVVEAMAASRPVVCSRAGGLAEIVISSEIGSALDGDSPEAYAEALLALIDQPERARAIGEAGCRSLRGRFDEATSAVRLAKLYQRCLGESEQFTAPVAERKPAIG